MNVVTLEGMTKRKAMDERDRLIRKGAKVPPLFTTDEEADVDIYVYMDMLSFLKKRRNGHFILVDDNKGILTGVSKYVFIN